MNRTFLCCVFSLASLLAVASAPLAAQETGSVVSAVQPSDRSNSTGGTVPPGCVSVPKGSGLWLVAKNELRDSRLWEQIYARNPFMQNGEARRVFLGPNLDPAAPDNAPKWTYVHTEPGELLCGLADLGLGAPALSTPGELQDMGFVLPTVTNTVTVEKISPWSWVPLGILAAVALALLALYLFFRRDPTRVGAGRVREEGIQTPAAAAEHTRAQLAQELGAQAALATIISMVRGRAYGWARITDRVGSFFRRLLRGEPTWEVTARLADGRQVIRYTLMACANDVRAGSGMMPGWGFWFVAEENVTDQIRTKQPPAPEPQPEPAPEPPPPPAPAPQSVPEPPPQTAAVSEDRDEEIQLREPDGEGFELVRLTNIDAANFTFRRGRTPAGASVLTFRYKRIQEGKGGPEKF